MTCKNIYYDRDRYLKYILAMYLNTKYTQLQCYSLKPLNAEILRNICLNEYKLCLIVH